MDTLPPQVEPECKAALLDVQAVAQLLKCSTRHVYRLADAGQMPLPTKLGVFRSLGALGRAVGPIAFCVIYWKFGSTASYASAAALLLGPWILVVGLPTPEKRN